MKGLRTSIIDGQFPEFVKDFMLKLYPNHDYEQWIVDALGSVNIHLTSNAGKQINI